MYKKTEKQENIYFLLISSFLFFSMFLCNHGPINNGTPSNKLFFYKNIEIHGIHLYILQKCSFNMFLSSPSFRK